MRQLVYAAVLAFLLAAPAAVLGQEKAPPPPSHPAEAMGLSKEQLVVIGTGVVIGALAVHLLIGADFTYFAGAVAGGLAADWWYEHGGTAQVPDWLKKLGDAAPQLRRLVPIAATRER